MRSACSSMASSKWECARLHAAALARSSSAAEKRTYSPFAPARLAPVRSACSKKPAPASLRRSARRSALTRATLRLGEIGAREVRPGEVGLVEHGVLQVRAREHGAAQVRAREDRALEVRAREVAAREVALA